ncbi:MAG TPA: DedA family protein [Chloroflexota bacterium]|nr:DedA family protein [Chloroflexota bacterium]
MTGLEAHFLTLIKHLLTAIGYPGVFVLMTIEGFGIPIPSELTMPFSGFLSSAAGGHKFILPVVVAIGAAGEITGGIIAYALGYYGGRPILDNYGRVVFLSPEDLLSAERWFARYGDWVVLVTRLLPAIRSFIALPAGVVRMPFWRFLVYGTIGSVVWCAVLALIGNALGQHWQQVSSGASRYNVILLLVLVALIAFAVYKRLAAGGLRRDRATSVSARKP